MKYVSQSVSCSKSISNKIYEMIDYIVANLTLEEYNIVFDIQTNTIISSNTNKTIKKIFHVVVDINESIFIIQNYAGEFMIPYNTYQFNLEDPSNLNTKFSLSQSDSGIPVNGLEYNGTPGRPGSAAACCG
jgi:hypothetical protein